MTEGDAAADSVDEIFASLLCFNMGWGVPAQMETIAFSPTRSLVLRRKASATWWQQHIYVVPKE